jgi:hypothetical protein
MRCFHLEPHFLLNHDRDETLSGLWRRSAGTVVLGQLLHNELLSAAAALLFLFARDANPIARLDPGYFSDKRIGLLIATVLKFEATGA